MDVGKWPPGKSPEERRVGPRNRRKERATKTSDQSKPASNPLFKFDSGLIEKWSGKYWSLISYSEKSAECRFEELLPRYRRSGYLDKAIFVELARWKSTRPTPRYQNNGEEYVQDVTRRAFYAKSGREALEALCELSGVQVRTASAILHWMRPQEFPILDFRVLYALGESTPPDWNDIALYERVAARLREEANKLGIDLRSVDRAIWAWQKAENDKR